jgi:hypothetical protein
MSALQRDHADPRRQGESRGETNANSSETNSSETNSSKTNSSKTNASKADASEANAEEVTSRFSKGRGWADDKVSLWKV